MFYASEAQFHGQHGRHSMSGEDVPLFVDESGREVSLLPPVSEIPEPWFYLLLLVGGVCLGCAVWKLPFESDGGGHG
jgi:hypothetical protein